MLHDVMRERRKLKSFNYTIIRFVWFGFYQECHILGSNCMHHGLGGDVDIYGCTTLSISSHTGYGSTSRGNINDLLTLPSQW